MPEATCAVTVTGLVTPLSDDSEPSYSPVLDVGDGGTVKVNPRTPGEGDQITLTVTPDPEFAVEQVSVTDRSGRDVDVADRRDGIYTFTQPRFLRHPPAACRPAVPLHPAHGP